MARASILFRLLAILLVGWTCGGMAAASEGRAYLNRFWQTSEGMPSNAVYGIAQDRDGFLWIATGAGVARFDGSRFEVFDTQNGLPDTQVHCILVDRSNRIWIGSRSGLAWRENGVWKVPANPPKTAVFSLGESADGTIWAGCYSSCWQVRNGTGAQVDLGFPEPDVRSFLDDGKGGTWILTRTRLLHRTRAGAVTEAHGPWEPRELTALKADARNRLILCGHGVLFRGNAAGTEWESLDSRFPAGASDYNLACDTDADGTLWIATRNGGLKYLNDRENGRIDALGSLSLDDVRGLLIDRQGDIWAGTNGGGLNRLRRRMFDTFGFTEGLGRTVTSAIAIAPDGVVRIGTDGSGIFRQDGGRFVPDLRDVGMPERMPVWSMTYDSKGALWVGTYRDGLFRIAGSRAESIPVAVNDAPKEICMLHETRDGGMLAGFYGNGLRKWKDGRMEKLLDGPDFTRGPIYDTLEDRKGRLWAATGASGLWLFENGSWRDLRVSAAVPDLLATILAETPDGDVWTGTLGQGLVRWHEDKPTRWTEKEGIISPVICQVQPDDHGYLWLGSDRGLQRLSLAELARTPPGDGQGNRIHGIRLSRADGLPTPQFSGEHGNLSAKAPDGSLWFSLAAGAIRVNPELGLKPSEPPVVRIESASTDRGPLWQFENPATRGRIEQEPGSGTLQIRFTSPDFASPEEMRFRYRMTGLEEEWQDSGGSRVASYPASPPGEYRFDVIAGTPDGQWSVTSTSITVVVKPFLWQTLGFRIAVGIVALTLLGILIRKWSLRRLKRKMARLVEETRLERERARIARDLHDDLGASLSEINFLGTLAADSLDGHPVQDRVEGMVDRAQRMAKSLDEIVWTVNPANDSLSSTANYLCSRSHESLRTAGIRCREEVADHLPNITFDSQLRHHLLMAVNEAVHNVMKHSGASECTLTIRLEGDDLVVSIADNGRGFRPEDVPENRNGLTNLARRMEASRGTLEITSTPGEGTLVTLRTPVSPA